MRRFLSVSVLLFSVSISAQVAAPAVEQSCVVSERKLTSDVTYNQICRTSEQGEPWSIHVLRVKRNTKAKIRAVAARNEQGEMVRELPTAMANRETANGKKVIAVVNGDYDFTSAGNMGVSIGLQIVDGRIWTGPRKGWPVMALTKQGEPKIGLPKVDISVRTGRASFQIAGMNKPLNQPEAGLLLTDEFRPKITTSIPVQSFVIGRVSVKGPLPLNHEIGGRVSQIQKAKTDTLVPKDAITVIVPEDTAAELKKVRRNDRVRLKITATVEGEAVTHAIGGFPILVRGGKRSIEGEPGENLRKRHPRTAVCYNEKEILFTVVDGRQPKLSVGMNLEELADLMVDLGCDIAMNTDGGGSTVMAITESKAAVRIVNSPSDGPERGRGNAFVIEAE